MKGILVDENGKPLTTETFRERFRRLMYVPTPSEILGWGLIVMSMVILCGLSAIYGGTR